jgi:hypothetical protein
MAETGSGDQTRTGIDQLELQEEVEDAVTRAETEGMHGHEALHAVMDELRPMLTPGTEHGVAAVVWQRLTDPEADHGVLPTESATTSEPPILLLEEIERAVLDVRAEGLSGRPARAEVSRRVAEAMGESADHARIVVEVHARMSSA